MYFVNGPLKEMFFVSIFIWLNKVESGQDRGKSFLVIKSYFSRGKIGLHMYLFWCVLIFWHFKSAPKMHLPWTFCVVIKPSCIRENLWMASDTVFFLVLYTLRLSSKGSLPSVFQSGATARSLEELLTDFEKPSAVLTSAETDIKNHVAFSPPPIHWYIQ